MFHEVSHRWIILMPGHQAREFVGLWSESKSSGAMRSVCFLINVGDDGLSVDNFDVPQTNVRQVHDSSRKSIFLFDIKIFAVVVRSKWFGSDGQFQRIPTREL